MDWERALVSKVAQTGSVEKLIGVVDLEHFARDANGAPLMEGQVWQHIVDHTQRYKAPPSLAAVRSKFPDFAFEITTDALDFLVDGFMGQVKRRATIDSLRDIANAIDAGDISDIESVFIEKARELAALSPAGSTSKFSDMQGRIQDYKKRQSLDDVIGIPYGIETIDKVTMGVQPTELVTLAGWSGTGKSTLMLYMAFTAYLEGYTPLIVSLEMGAEQVMRKLDTLAVHFEYEALKQLELGTGDLAKWERWAEQASNASNDIIVKDVSSGLGKGATVDRIYSEVNRYKPDMVLVDYIGLMEASRSKAQRWEEISSISRELKLMATSARVPVVSVAQTNPVEDGGYRGSNIAGSKDIMRDSDVMLELRADEEMKKENKANIVMVKNRDGKLINQMMLWLVGTMTFRMWTDTMPFTQRQIPEEPVLKIDLATGIQVVEGDDGKLITINTETGEVLP